MRSWYALEALVLALAMALCMLAISAVGCAHTLTPAEQKAAEASAEASYGAALLACVADSDTREQADSCTDAVNDRFGRLPDGGRK